MPGHSARFIPKHFFLNQTLSTRELPELNLLVLANALSVLAQILGVYPRDTTFYENNDIMVKSHRMHENSGV